MIVLRNQELMKQLNVSCFNHKFSTAEFHQLKFHQAVCFCIVTFTYAIIQTAFVADQLRASTAGFHQFFIMPFTENSLIFPWCLFINWYRYSFMLVTKIEVMCLQVLQYYTLLLVTNIDTNLQRILAAATIIVAANHYGTTMLSRNIA